MKTYGLSKAEKLCSDKAITQLFNNGNSFVKFPLRVVYSSPVPSDSHIHCQILTSVPKKRFKRAVKRNHIKRLMRETYRLNKHILTDTLADNMLNIAFVYVDSNISSFDSMQKAMVAALTRISKAINNKDKHNPDLENVDA